MLHESFAAFFNISISLRKISAVPRIGNVIAYRLFGIFMKWAKGGYAESVQEMIQIVVERIFTGNME